MTGAYMAIPFATPHLSPMTTGMITQANPMHPNARLQIIRCLRYFASADRVGIIVVNDEHMVKSWDSIHRLNQPAKSVTIIPSEMLWRLNPGGGSAI